MAKSVTTPSPIISWLPLDRQKEYTQSYSTKLYERLSTNLKKRYRLKKHDLLANVNLVLLYIHKDDESESWLFEKFGTEALLVPLQQSDIVDRTLITGNQKRHAVNDLARKQKQAMRRAESLLSAISEEVTNRDNKTCLLLPPKNFGRDIEKVFDCIRNVSLAGDRKEGFQKKLNRTLGSLRTVREDGRTYIVGQGGLVFKSPGKAGARHGLAPVWETPGHDLSCVIRGRVRFGVSYDPRFHYDCDISKDNKRRFPSCHGSKTIPRNRGHVNIAPNDNVR